VYGTEAKLNCFAAPLHLRIPASFALMGATDGDDFAPDAEFDNPRTCKIYMDMFKTYEEESDMCKLSLYFAGGSCCPSSLSYSENPCVACPNGITAGDDFAPYAGIDYLMPCLKIH
jgi:hypothetical protein